MKKHLLWILLFIFLLTGCEIKYSSNIEITPPPSQEGGTLPPSSDNNEEKDDDNEDNNNPAPETNATDLINNPDINSFITINPNDHFYPASLNINDPKILQYSYIDSRKTNDYRIYSAYYSQYYDTLYIAYDSISSPIQTLKAKDLYQIERHALHYFQTDNNKTDYKDYLKAILIYPDTLASSCRQNITDDESITINGCANYVGKEAIISLNRLKSLDVFYNESRYYINSTQYYPIEPLRYTYAHEFGHISTYYNMVYKNDEDYEDYLNLRLADAYNTVYPTGLPSYYDSSAENYYKDPLEILADDYVELFYNTSSKVSEDTYDYTLDAGYSRNSLKGYDTAPNLKNNQELYTQVKNYYITNFLNYNNKLTYTKPIVVTTNLNYIEYYKSYSEIGITNSRKIIPSSFTINLIAVGEVTINDIKYYRVILSNTTNIVNGRHDEKKAGKNLGYVLASNYTVNNKIKIYEINYDRQNSRPMGKNSMAPIEPTNSSIYVLPYYDFSYVLNLTNDNNYATMYDYLNSNISQNKYRINIYSFGTLIN